MSRCFPFPPPGYERKLRVDDGNLLAKEKDNDKKRKRDKERKEKDKDRSKEKHRERNKEKKEKHKHKDKDKNKDKDQSRDEKRFRGEGLVEKVSLPSQALDGRNGYVDGATGNQLVNSGNDGNFHKRDDISDSAVPRFDHKVNGHRDNGQTRFPKVASVCNLNGLDQRRVGAIKPEDRTIDKTKKENEKEKDHRSDQKGENKEEKQKHKDGKRFEGHAEIKDTKYVQALAKRIRDEKHDAIGSHVIASSQERVEPVEKLANGSAPTYSVHAKKISKFASGVENGERGNNGSKTTGVALVHNSKGLEQRGCKVARPSGMGKNVSIEEARRNAYGGISEKILLKDKEEDNFKQGGDNIIKLSRLGESCKDSNTVSSRQSTLKASNNGASKWKVPEANGFIHGNETRPERLPRTVFSSPPAEKSSIVAQKSLIGSIKPQASTPKANGMMVRESPTSSAKPLSSSDVKTINGMIFAQESAIKPQPVANGKTTDGNGLDAKKLASISTKPKKHKEKSSKPPPPHPDIKYLSTILSIPKIEEWSGFDDQDWLFEKNNNCPSTETKVGTSEGDLQVWAKAVHIEAVDLYALPYVIPY